jgi:hypothetical protein
MIWRSKGNARPVGDLEPISLLAHLEQEAIRPAEVFDPLGLTKEDFELVRQTKRLCYSKPSQERKIQKDDDVNSVPSSICFSEMGKGQRTKQVKHPNQRGIMDHHFLLLCLLLCRVLGLLLKRLHPFDRQLKLWCIASR